MIVRGLKQEAGTGNRDKTQMDNLVEDRRQTYQTLFKHMGKEWPSGGQINYHSKSVAFLNGTSCLSIPSGDKVNVDNLCEDKSTIQAVLEPRWYKKNWLWLLIYIFNGWPQMLKYPSCPFCAILFTLDTALTPSIRSSRLTERFKMTMKSSVGRL